MGEFEVTAEVDFQSLVTSIRMKEKALLKSVNSPGVKRAIHEDVRDSLFSKPGNVPFKTGALLNSPMFDDYGRYGHGRLIYESATGKTKKYAKGGVDDKGIHWDPYVKSPSHPSGFEYADYAEFYPAWIIRANMPIVREIVKKHLMEDLS